MKTWPFCIVAFCGDRISDTPSYQGHSLIPVVVKEHPDLSSHVHWQTAKSPRILNLFVSAIIYRWKDTRRDAEEFSITGDVGSRGEPQMVVKSKGRVSPKYAQTIQVYIGIIVFHLPRYMSDDLNLGWLIHYVSGHRMPKTCKAMGKSQKRYLLLDSSNMIVWNVIWMMNLLYQFWLHARSVLHSTIQDHSVQQKKSYSVLQKALVCSSQYCSSVPPCVAKYSSRTATP